MSSSTHGYTHIIIYTQYTHTHTCSSFCLNRSLCPVTIDTISLDAAAVADVTTPPAPPAAVLVLLFLLLYT